MVNLSDLAANDPEEEGAVRFQQLLRFFEQGVDVCEGLIAQKGARGAHQVFGLRDFTVAKRADKLMAMGNKLFGQMQQLLEWEKDDE